MTIAKTNIKETINQLKVIQRESQFYCETSLRPKFEVPEDINSDREPNRDSFNHQEI